ncbi:hypothetical protein OG311_35720 [Streptomyces sp. NBC_01343]|uniref:hypothetical protein n=1 Tax=Streptomyces sp. NBC_01343 TaxID=2903832 RepID=UPI002E14C5A0|nr:hypothetical protein OG311_35720 [Streptomyces sp. NBC_01343]
MRAPRASRGGARRPAPAGTGVAVLAALSVLAGCAAGGGGTSATDGRTAYVTGGFTRDGYWDGITVVDLPSGTTRRLPAGHRPLGIVVL